MSGKLSGLLGSLAGFFFAIAFASLDDGTAMGQVGPCPACRAEYVSQLTLMGSYECEHGPEWDQPDCGANPNCCETAPGGCPANAGALNNGVCSCFTCGNAVGWCEPYMTRWRVWCGSGNGAVCGAVAVAGPQGVIGTVQNMTVAFAPLACNPQSGVVTVAMCGGGADTLSCKAPANTCVPFGNQQNIMGAKDTCKPGS